ncbi:MAG: tetratricopeptide repeat protein [Planctomycetes bacterium]|nr:tetratricopeptide repeat protein [Planctomycetota bacterium]
MSSVDRSPRPRGARLALVLAATVLALGAVRSASAADAPGAPPWARAITDGVADQDREIAQRGAKAVMTRWANKAQRASDLVTLYLLARAYGKAGDAASALSTYTDVLRAEPRCWFAWRDRGVLRLLGKDRTGGESDLRQAVSLQPAYVDALQPLGDLLVDDKRFEEGVRVLRAALDAEPGNDRVRLQLVAAYAEWGRPREAIATLDPLISRAPRDPGLRLLRARLVSETGDLAGAMAAMRQLATEAPDRQEPLRAWLGVAQKAGDVAPDDLLWVLERLRRLLTGDERKRLDVEIDKIRRQVASGGAAAPPAKPTPELIARQMRDADPKARERAMLWLVLAAKEDFVVGGDLLVALVERLDDRREPVATNRALALAVFERWSDPRLAPVVRTSLRDADGRVRCRAADALGSMGNLLAVPVLSVHAVGTDVELATAARLAVYALAKTVAPEAEPTPEAQVVAFQTWWAGALARDVKLRAVDAVMGSADIAPYDVLYPLALDDDPAVWTVAYRALGKLAAQAAGATAPRAVWMRALPVVPDADLVAEKRDAYRTTLSSWWGKRPQ